MRHTRRSTQEHTGDDPSSTYTDVFRGLDSLKTMRKKEAQVLKLYFHDLIVRTLAVSLCAAASSKLVIGPSAKKKPNMAARWTKLFVSG
jgi:hypothetical protein